jgi:cell fate (sporulation/competence/biofilm development) regulator YlbF (YheA/YmcA/DUF963 family)
MVKAIFFWLVLISLSVFGYQQFTRLQAESFCSTPITFKIGTIDERFNLTPDELKKITGSASLIWENKYLMPLFIYDKDSTLDINMVYSEAHTILRSISEDQNIVNSEQTKLTASLAEYEQKRKALQSKIDNLNAEIKEWNDKGGATKEKYDRIKRLNAEIKKDIDAFNAYSNALNYKTQTYNFDVSKLNETISQFNDKLQESPEMGVYISGDNRIEIYFYEGANDLKNVIAHELGHAIGLNHIATVDAIMNPNASINTRYTTEDSDLLDKFCKNNTQIDRLKYEFLNYAYPYRMMLKEKLQPILNFVPQNWIQETLLKINQ